MAGLPYPYGPPPELPSSLTQSAYERLSDAASPSYHNGRGAPPRYFGDIDDTVDGDSDSEFIRPHQRQAPKSWWQRLMSGGGHSEPPTSALLTLIPLTGETRQDAACLAVAAVYMGFAQTTMRSERQTRPTAGADFTSGVCQHCGVLTRIAMRCTCAQACARTGNACSPRWRTPQPWPILPPPPACKHVHPADACHHRMHAAWQRPTPRHQPTGHAMHATAACSAPARPLQTSASSPGTRRSWLHFW